MVLPEPLGPVVVPGHQELMDLMVLLAPAEAPVLRELMVRTVPLVLQEPAAPLGRVDPPEALGHLELMEATAHLGQVEPLARLGLPGLTVLMGLQVQADPPGVQEPVGHLVHPGQMVLMGPLVPAGPQGLPVLMEHQALRGLLGHRAPMGAMEPVALQGPAAPRERMALMAHQAQVGHPGLLEPTEPAGHRAPPEVQEQTDLTVQAVVQARRGRMAVMVLRAVLEAPVQAEHLVRAVPVGRLVLMDHMVPPGPLGAAEHLARASTGRVPGRSPFHTMSTTLSRMAGTPTFVFRITFLMPTASQG